MGVGVAVLLTGVGGVVPDSGSVTSTASANYELEGVVTNLIF